MSFVVTGTDTGVGKTVFAAALVTAIGGSYWKPIQAGLDELSDTESVMRLAGLSADRIFPEAYRLNSPCSPHRAAELDEIAINPERLLPPASDGPLIIEGAGGVLVPLTHSLTFADMFERWGLPVIIVARTSLGTINHSLLTIEALRLRGIAIHGIAFVGDANHDSEATIAEMGGVRRLGRLDIIESLDRSSLAAAFARGFDMRDFTS